MASEKYVLCDPGFTARMKKLFEELNKKPLFALVGEIEEYWDKKPEAIGVKKTLLTPDEGGQDIEMIYRVPNKTGKGFSSIDLKRRDLAKLPPVRIIGMTTKGIIIVANDSVKGQGGRSVNSDQHPDPHTGERGSSTVGLGKIQMENSGSVQGQDGGATPHIGRTEGTTANGLPFSQASNSVDGQEASSSGHNGGSGARSGSDESDQSTGSGGTDTDEGVSVGGDEHDEDDRDEGNDEDGHGVGELESGTRRRVRNSRSMSLVAIFIAIVVTSTCAIITLSSVGLSPLVKKLFTGALFTNLVGFLCLHATLFPNRHRSRRATKILVRGGGTAAAIGFLLMLGIRLSLRIVILACLFVLAVFGLSFRR